MDKRFHLKTVFLGAFVLLAFAYAGGLLIANQRLDSLRNKLAIDAAEQEALLTIIAETTARNGADEVTESVIRDCNIEERTQFDALLGRLDSGLSRDNLIVLERLFGRCGSFYSERKSVMVARLAREVEVYENNVAQIAELGGVDVEEYKVKQWQELVVEEKKLSSAFDSLVERQDEIISALHSGKSADSVEIKAILAEVKKSQLLLQEANMLTAEKRNILTAL